MPGEEPKSKARTARAGTSLRVLTYHRVAEEGDPQLDPSLISATPSVFYRQMEHLKRSFSVVSMADVLDAVEDGTGLPDRAVLITFDDAYHDFIEFAWPVLKRLQLPATVFTATDYAGQPERPFWWDRVYGAIMRSPHHRLDMAPFGQMSLESTAHRCEAVKRIQSRLKAVPAGQAEHLVEELSARAGEERSSGKVSLDWDELRCLAKEGVTIGAHTRTHPILTGLTPEALRREVVGCREDLLRELGEALPVFCYPSGVYDGSVLRMVGEAGFRLAFTTEEGCNDLRCTDQLRLRRTNITRRTSVPIFKLRLLRPFVYVDAWRHRKERQSL